MACGCGSLCTAMRAPGRGASTTCIGGELLRGRLSSGGGSSKGRIDACGTMVATCKPARAAEQRQGCRSLTQAVCVWVRQRDGQGCRPTVCIGGGGRHAGRVLHTAGTAQQGRVRQHRQVNSKQTAQGRLQPNIKQAATWRPMQRHVAIATGPPSPQCGCRSGRSRRPGTAAAGRCLCSRAAKRRRPRGRRTCCRQGKERWTAA